MIKCSFCSNNVSKISSTRCDECKKEFCLKHRLSFDHNCNKTILIKKVETLKAQCCICKDSINEVKSCCNCTKLFCIGHLAYLNHNCNYNKKVSMKETFLNNKNKILNDLKAKKLLKNISQQISTINESSNNDFNLIKENALGDNKLIESQRHYFRIVQNCQIQFDEIKGFPIYRFYDNKCLISDILENIITELQLSGNNYIINQKNDIYLKSVFPKEKRICEITILKNGDTIMLSKINES